MPVISVEMGAMADPLWRQPIGKLLSDIDCEHFQKDADAIARLFVRGILSHNETAKARSRLLKKITQSAKSAK